MAAGPLVRVNIGRGNLIKMTPAIAEKYIRDNPGAFIMEPRAAGTPLDERMNLQEAPKAEEPKAEPEEPAQTSVTADHAVSTSQSPAMKPQPKKS